MPTKKKRTKAQDLPKTEQELTADEAKRVQGGCTNNLSPIAQKVADGSVRVANITDGTSNTLLIAENR